MRPDKTKQCGVCKEIVPAKAIGKHINERHFPEVKWNCHYCQKDFPNRESANSHISHASCIFNATVSAVVDGYIQPAATWRTVKAHWAVAELYRVTAGTGATWQSLPCQASMFTNLLHLQMALSSATCRTAASPPIRPRKVRHPSSSSTFCGTIIACWTIVMDMPAGGANVVSTIFTHCGTTSRVQRASRKCSNWRICLRHLTLTLFANTWLKNQSERPNWVLWSTSTHVGYATAFPAAPTD